MNKFFKILFLVLITIALALTSTACQTDASVSSSVSVNDFELSISQADTLIGVWKIKRITSTTTMNGIKTTTTFDVDVTNSIDPALDSVFQMLEDVTFEFKTDGTLVVTAIDMNETIQYQIIDDTIVFPLEEIINETIPYYMDFKFENGALVLSYEMHDVDFSMSMKIIYKKLQ